MNGGQGDSPPSIQIDVGDRVRASFVRSRCIAYAKRRAAHDPHDYLLQELRCASLRARLWQPDIDAVGAALKAGWITSEQAVETLNDCDCFQLIAPKE